MVKPGGARCNIGCDYCFYLHKTELLAPVSEVVAQHVKTLKDYPPVQGGTSFDMSNIIADTIQKGPQ